MRTFLGRKFTPELETVTDRQSTWIIKIFAMLFVCFIEIPIPKKARWEKIAYFFTRNTSVHEHLNIQTYTTNQWRDLVKQNFQGFDKIFVISILIARIDNQARFKNKSNNHCPALYKKHTLRGTGQRKSILYFLMEGKTKNLSSLVFFLMFTFLCRPRKTTANAPCPMSSLGLYSKSPTVSKFIFDELINFFLLLIFSLRTFQFWGLFVVF